MSILLNDPGCAINSGNSGLPGCRFDPSLIVSAILVDKDKTFTLSTAATFISDMQTLCTQTRALRAFPIHGFTNMEDKSTEPAFKELGYGSRQKTSDGKYDFVFQLGAGGHAYHSNLMHFNDDQTKRVLFIDSNNVVLGAKTGAATFKGFKMEFFCAPPFKMASGKDAPALYTVEFALTNPRELNQDLAYFNLGTDPESAFQGLLDIEMVDLGAGSATKKQVIGVRSILDKVSLYDAYSALIVTNYATIFTATLSGSAANPVGCVAKPTVKGFELEFGATGAHIVTMCAASVLAGFAIGGAGDIGYDIETAGTLTVTVA